MKPVLFTLFNQSISSFGVFLILALFAATFIIWRIVRVYELDEEKTIDLLLLSVIGGLLFSRSYYVLTNLSLFDDFLKAILFSKYPGLSFWGALLGGGLTMKYFSGRLKIHFWQAADFAAVGLFLGIAIASLGCLLGGCQYGLISNSAFEVSLVGVVGKRFPLQVVESLIFFIGFLYLWSKVLKFHFNGQIASIGLILLGGAKFILEFYRGDRQKIWGDVSSGFLFSILLIILGIFSYYTQGKKQFGRDLVFLLSLLVNRQSQNFMVSKFKKSWYNFWVNLRVSSRKMSRTLFKMLRIKSNPGNF